MQTRCPVADCFHIFETSDNSEFNVLDCPSCRRAFTVRSLARHLEIDKQVKKHMQQGTYLNLSNSGLNAGAQLIVALEEVRSLWNVGSIFRSADGAGFKKLFLIGITGCPPRKEISKTSLGAENYISWSYCGNSLELLAFLKSSGYQTIALERTEKSVALSQALNNSLLKPPLCLVLGSEVKGVYKETLDLCDLIVSLPMRGQKESLNVAVAFGIAAYAIAEHFS